VEKWQVSYEEIKLRAEDLLEKVNELFHERKARQLIIKNEQGHTFIEIPVTVAAVAAVATPIVAAIGTIPTLVEDCHGTREWDIFMQSTQRVYPDRETGTSPTATPFSIPSTTWITAFRCRARNIFTPPALMGGRIRRSIYDDRGPPAGGDLPQNRSRRRVGIRRHTAV
jgi:hypothetical protein